MILIKNKQQQKNKTKTTLKIERFSIKYIISPILKWRHESTENVMPTMLVKMKQIVWRNLDSQSDSRRTHKNSLWGEDRTSNEIG